MMPKDEQSFCLLGGLVIKVEGPNCLTCFSQEMLKSPDSFLWYPLPKNCRI